MSMKLTALAMDVRVGNPLRKLVLLKLCDNANDEGVCWPSIQGIAHVCEISERSVRNHIAALEQDGFLRVIHRSQNGKSITNRYFISLQRNAGAAKKPPVADAEQQNFERGDDETISSNPAGNAPLGVQDLQPLGVQEIPLGVQEIPFRGAGDAAKPVIKPINNTTSNKTLLVHGYPEWFESLWKNYPARLGSNDKRKAFNACRARLKNGVDLDSLQKALARYSFFVLAMGRVGTEYVMQAATFFGPGGHIDNPWDCNQVSNRGSPARGAAGRTTVAQDLTDRSWGQEYL